MAFRIIPELTATDIRRLKAKIAPPNENGCELWLGAPDKNGYGKIELRVNGHDYTFRAHRVAYFLHYGVDPSELLVCHNCPGGDNPACTAKAHLFLGTNQENMLDGRKKKQFEAGEARYNSKVTVAIVREIRALRGIKPQRTVGRMYGITGSAVSLIWHRKNWAHVE